MQARRQRCPAIPDLLGADQPESRILRQLRASFGSSYPAKRQFRPRTHRHKKVQSEPSDGAKPRPRGTNAEESGTWSEELTKHQFAACSLEERLTSTRAISNSARMRFQARRGVIRRRHYFELPIQGCASKIFVHSISSMQRVTYWLTRHLIGF